MTNQWSIRLISPKNLSMVCSALFYIGHTYMCMETLNLVKFHHDGGDRLGTKS